MKTKIWRAKGRVAWSLYESPQRRQAHIELDHAFDLAVDWMRLHVGPDGASPEILDSAFGALGRTLRKWAHLGATDTEPSANVRRALAHRADEIRQECQERLRRKKTRSPLDYTPRAFHGARFPDGLEPSAEAHLARLGLLAGGLPEARNASQPAGRKTR
jgi:hypothetical protein